MGEGFLKFSDVDIKKKEFHCFKFSDDIGDAGDINIDKIVISEKFLSKKVSGCKHFASSQKRKDYTVECHASKNERVSKKFQPC